MPYQTIRLERSPHTLTATLTRGDRQNTLNALVLEDLHQALDQAERTEDCPVFVLQGHRGVFSAGMDFDEAARRPAASPAEEPGGREFYRLLKRFTTARRVVIANVDGRVSGGGVGLAAASDFVVATKRSQFGLPEALWGLLPCCVLPFLIRRVGFQKAYSMTLSTQAVDAVKAEGCGLVDFVSDEPALTIKRLTLRFSKLHPETLKDIKRYCGKLWMLSDEIESLATGELARLMSSPLVMRNLHEYVTTRRFPWEAREP